MNEHYPLKPFRIRTAETLVEIMESYPLATIMTGAAGSALMTLLPLLVEQDEAGSLFLVGHLDRNNPQAERLVVGEKISFHFLGPTSYVSPDIYPTDQFPGWLYVSVQGDGVVKAEIAEDDLRALLIRSTVEFGEKDQRYALDLSDPRVDLYLPLILGFRIEITRISGIAKLAQDKGEADSRRALEFLVNQNNSGSRTLFEKILIETL